MTPMAIIEEAGETDNHNTAQRGIPISANTAGPTGFAVISVVTADQKQKATKMRPQKTTGWVAVSETSR